MASQLALMANAPEASNDFGWRFTPDISWDFCKDHCKDYKDIII